MINNQLDEIDKNILNALQKDARMHVRGIAAAVNLTPTPIHRRIRLMEEAGYIKGYVPILDRAKIGKPVLVTVMVKLESQTRRLLDEFENAVTQLPPVQSCLLVTGNWNFLLQVSAATPQEYNNFLMDGICSMENVKYTESLFTLKECKSFGSFVL
jgi:Lrp/AsnC family leucine-responsive transcriptional regulator